MTSTDNIQLMIDRERWRAALATLGDVEPVLAEVLANLNLRVYPGDAPHGDRTAHVVVDLHGVSIGLGRRCCGLYLHVDTTGTDDRLIGFEINGGGETHHLTGPYPSLDDERGIR